MPAQWPALPTTPAMNRARISGALSRIATWQCVAMMATASKCPLRGVIWHPEPGRAGLALTSSQRSESHARLYLTATAVRRPCERDRPAWPSTTNTRPGPPINRVDVEMPGAGCAGGGRTWRACRRSALLRRADRRPQRRDHPRPLASGLPRLIPSRWPRAACSWRPSSASPSRDQPP